MTHPRYTKPCRSLGWMLFALVLLCRPVMAGDGLGRSQGQTVYVPIYSHIYTGNRDQPIYLAATLSIRNTDPTLSITLLSVDYYDSDGKLIKRYLETPLTLKAMASTSYVIKEADKSGGSGANFLVRWRSDRAVSPPLMESIMVSTRSQIGVSFTSQGVVIDK